ncbi:unnamed protein product [Blepharisma stoltei]|uniref:Palmitoyltransferase n=1 Tax=Blepharisma stoltei TaxID=1481888 RepID=A0AAU9K155_9CILI|nr:unnamed protein product [Blepharisma stoltei]
MNSDKNHEDLDIQVQSVNNTFEFPYLPPDLYSKQLWELWPGNNRFLFKGKFMIGPSCDNIHFFGTLIGLIAVPSSFFLFISSYLWENVTIVIPILSIYCYAFTIFFYFLTLLTEPGIIPRKKIYEALGGVPKVFTADVIFMENGPLYKFCQTCEIFRPPRSHHCAKCDNCVELFDHHCPYLNNCIGARNYIYFVIFVTHLVLLGLVDLAGFLAFLFYKPGSYEERTFINQEEIILIIVVILTILLLILTILIGILCIFHFSLCITGETTKERINRSKGSKRCLLCRYRHSRFDWKTGLKYEQVILLKANSVDIEISESEQSPE